MNFKEDVKKTIGIELNEQQLKQFEDYFAFLVEYNKITNLTRITEYKEVYYKHFYDSLMLSKFVDLKSIHSICDLGSGAGFPGIPLKIIFPHLTLSIVDSLKKRIIFLEKLISILNIESVELNHNRIEDFAITHQKSFDIVIARALGRLNLITEMAIPIVKESHHFIAYKSLGYQDEINQASNTLKKLQSTIEEIYHYELPFNLGYRTLIKIKKLSHVEGYPRSFALMQKKPL